MSRRVVLVAHHASDGVGGSAERTKGIVEGLEALGYEVIWYQLAPDLRWFRRRLGTRWWYHALRRSDAAALAQLVDGATAVVVAYLPVAKAVLPVLRSSVGQGVRWIYAAENDEIAVARASALAPRLLRQTARDQAAVLRAFPEAWVAGTADARNLQRSFPGTRVVELPSGARGSVRTVETPPLARAAFTFGSWGYPPNAEGLRRLLSAGDASGNLDIYGNAPADLGEVVAAHSDGSGLSARLLGFADSIEAMVSTTRGPGIVPVWGGAGTKLRVVELAQRGVPIYAPKHAFDGLPEFFRDLAGGIHDDPVRLLEAAFSGDGLAWRRASDLARMVAEQFTVEALIKSAWESGLQ